MFCKQCGKELPAGALECPNCAAGTEENPSPAKNTDTAVKPVTNPNTFRYVSGAVALACAILPFLHWVEVPILNSLTSFFGGSGEECSYSLFGYVFSVFANSSNDMTMALIMLVFAVVALISSVINAIYAVKCFIGKTSLKLGKTGSVILLIMSIIFLIVVGLIAAIFKIISLTFTVYVAIAMPIANIIIIKQLKKAENA